MLLGIKLSVLRSLSLLRLYEKISNTYSLEDEGTQDISSDCLLCKKLSQ